MSSSTRRFVLGGVAVPIVLVGSMLCATSANAASSTVNSKASLNSAFGSAANGDVITLGQDLLGDGGVNDVLAIPSNTSATLNLNGHELDVDRVEVGDSSTFVVKSGTLVVGGASVSPSDTAATGIQVASAGFVEIQNATHVTAIGSSDRAGIGTIAGDDVGAVAYINAGATVTATGGSHGAGIGGGAGAVPLRTISIGDANVTATGGAGAAGIGGGQASGAGTGKGSNVTLNDAEVTVADGGVASGGGAAPSAIGGGQGAAAADWGTLTRTASGTTGRRDTLRVAAGAVLNIPSGKTVANPSTLLVRGTLTGAGTVTNAGAIRTEGAGVLDDAALTVTGNTVAVTFDAAGGTTTAPTSQRVYAKTFADAGLDLAAYTGSNGGRALAGWTHGGTAVTNADDLSAIATSGTVALTAAYAAAVTTSGGGGGTGGAGATGTAGTTGGTATPATSGQAAAPELPVFKATTVKLGHPLSLSLAASSATAVTYTAKGLPDGIALNASTGQLYGAPRTAGRYVVTVTATNGGGSTTGTVTIVVPEATHVITGSLGAVTPAAGGSVKVTIRGLKVGERWTIAVDGKPVNTGVTRFGGTVTSSVKLAKKAKDTKHMIRVSSDRKLTDASLIAAHELTVTAVVAKKALHLTKKGTTLTVRGLAAKERVTIKRGHTTVASGRADAKGVFIAKKKSLKHGVLVVTGSAKHRTGKLTVK